MPAPSYETLKQQKAEVEKELMQTRGELEEARTDASTLSESAAQADVLRVQLRRCINFFDNMVKSLDLGASVETQIERFVLETEKVLNATTTH